MKPSDFHNTEIEGDSFEGMDAGIDKKNLSFLFDIVSKQMYRKPIPSIVREITSNCFDSHIEAKINDPVIIELAEDEGGYYISFNDVGVGMSPERMKKTYSKWFSSTKRDTNDQIGMFGLGSKSPLAYADSFYLNTVFGEKRYEYTIHKGQKTPRIDLLIEDDALGERNQTQVKIYVKNYSDLCLFKDACKSQLAYFDNVYIKSDLFAFNNVYTIQEFDTFKFRNDYQYSSELHVIIGKVPYPIDWDVIGRERIILPFGLKFEIGDLQVTPERESIRYVDIVDDQGNTKTSKEIIATRIVSFLDEISSLYYARVDNTFDDYERYLSYTTEIRAWLPLGPSQFEVTKYITKKKGVFTPLKDFKGSLPSNLFFEYTFSTWFTRSGKVQARDYDKVVTKDILDKHLCVTHPVASKFNKKKVAYLFDKAADLSRYATFYTFVESRKGLSGLLRLLQIKVKSKLYNYEETNALKQVKMFREYVKSEINRLTFNYDLVDIPQEWLTAYNLQHQRNSVKGEDEILVYDYGKRILSESKSYINPAHYEEYTGFIVYGYEEHEELLKNYRELFASSKYGYLKDLLEVPRNLGDFIIHPKRCKLFKIAQRNTKYFLKFKHAVFIENFMSNNKIFKKFATAAMVEKESKALTLTGFPHQTGRHYIDVMDSIFPPVADVTRELKEAVKDFGGTCIRRNTVSDTFIDDFIEVAKKHDLYDKPMYENHQKLEKYSKGLDLINFIAIQDDNVHLIADFLALKGKRIHDIWASPLPYERELLTDLLNKINYLLSLYSAENYIPCQVYLHLTKGITSNYVSKTEAHLYRIRESGIFKGELTERKGKLGSLEKVFNALTNYQNASEKTN